MRFGISGFLTAMFLAISAARADGELHIFNWGDYTSPKVIEKFSKTYDVEVFVDEYQTVDEMLATVRAGNSGYDIVVPTLDAVQIMIGEGLLAETKPNQMANFKNVDPSWIDVDWDPGRNYSVPNLWGTTALAIDTSMYTGDANTLKLLFDPPPPLQGKIGVVSETADVIQAAWRYLGKPQCSGSPADIEALSELLTTSKRHWRSIAYGLMDEMSSGDLALTLTWNGVAMRVRQQAPTWTYVYPREGYAGWMDNIVVPKDAPALENAKLFQNFMMEPEIAALNSAYSGYANAILGSDKFLPAEIAEAPEMKLPVGGPAPEFVPLCPKEVRDKYDVVWAELLSQ